MKAAHADVTSTHLSRKREVAYDEFSARRL
jgi:hypothetical protein